MGGSASPHGARATKAQGLSVAHRPRLADVDRAPHTVDSQEHDSDQERQDEARAPPNGRTSFTIRYIPFLLARLREFCRPSKPDVAALWSA